MAIPKDQATEKEIGQMEIRKLISIGLNKGLCQSKQWEWLYISSQSCPQYGTKEEGIIHGSFKAPGAETGVGSIATG